jgi:very-short-patch-repair endonuclease
MNPMQKRNKRVDKIKDEWALMHGIPLIRIWEKDIKENPNQVMEMLKKRLYIQDKKVEVRINKNKRHINKIK